MSEWAARRFWQDATVERVAGGHAVRLDGRAVRTPLKTELIVPSRALANGVAAEWHAQGQKVDPLSMPLTRAVNATLDKVFALRGEVAAGLAEYGGSDLLCYRATHPDVLVERQAEAWDPMLDWAAARFGGGRLRVTSGVMPAEQPPTALAALRARVENLTEWELTPLSEFVSLSGSLVLGLASLEGRDPNEMWRLSRIDENWQSEQWGEDEEEAERVARKRDEFLQARRFLDLLREG
jgi:chaperone required for assembly of F1-ATPase